MATPLRKSIAREFQHGSTWYKIVVSADGIRVTRKGARRGIQLSWDDVLTFDEDRAEEAAVATTVQATNAGIGRKSKLGMPDVVAADVILLMRRATETLTEASSLIDTSSEIPALLAAHREPPHSREEERSDWYIEPLLTLRQVSTLLSISTRRVRNLPLKAIELGEEVRYQPAEVRRFLATQSVTKRAGYRT